MLKDIIESDEIQKELKNTDHLIYLKLLVFDTNEKIYNQSFQIVWDSVFTDVLLFSIRKGGHHTSKIPASIMIWFTMMTMSVIPSLKSFEAHRKYRIPGMNMFPVWSITRHMTSYKDEEFEMK